MNLSPSARAKRGGVFFKLLVFLVVLAAVVVTAWIYVLPNLLTSTLKKRTGFDVKVTDLQLNLFTGQLNLNGFVIQNPDTFARREFLEIRTVRASADARSLFSDRPVIHSAEIDVAHIAIIRNADGTLNASLFNSRLFPQPPPVDPKAKPSDKPAPAPAPKPKEKPLNFLIESLTLKLDKIIVADLSSRNVKTKDYDVNIREVYTNVTDPKQLAQPIVKKLLPVVGDAISALLPGGIGSIIGTATKSGSDALNEVGKKATDALKSLSDTLEETPKP